MKMSRNEEIARTLIGSALLLIAWGMVIEGVWEHWGEPVYWDWQSTAMVVLLGLPLIAITAAAIFMVRVVFFQKRKPELSEVIRDTAREQD